MYPLKEIQNLQQMYEPLKTMFHLPDAGNI